MHDLAHAHYSLAHGIWQILSLSGAYSAAAAMMHH